MRLTIELDGATVQAAVSRTGLNDRRAAIEVFLRSQPAGPHPYDALLDRFGSGANPGYDPNAGQPDAWRSVLRAP